MANIHVAVDVRFVRLFGFATTNWYISLSGHEYSLSFSQIHVRQFPFQILGSASIPSCFSRSGLGIPLYNTLSHIVRLCLCNFVQNILKIFTKRKTSTPQLAKKEKKCYWPRHKKMTNQDEAEQKWSYRTLLLTILRTEKEFVNRQTKTKRQWLLNSFVFA